MTTIKRMFLSTWWRRLRADSRGVTMAEICVALMILSIGMVSILALFPKALSSTRAIMGLTTSSMVVRSAVATMVYNIEEDDGTPGCAWPTGTRGDLNTYQGTVTSDPPTTTIVTSGVGAAYDVDHFLLIKSGRARGMVYDITGGSLNSYQVTEDAGAHGVTVGDSIEIIGAADSTGDQGRISPSVLIASDDPPLELYAWAAIICDEEPNVNGLYRTFIFVYGRDACNGPDSVVGDITKINKYKPVYCCMTYLAKEGT